MRNMYFLMVSYIFETSHSILVEMISFNFPLVFVFKTYSEFISVSFFATSLGQTKSLQLRSGTEVWWGSRSRLQEGVYVLYSPDSMDQGSRPPEK